MDCDRFCSTPDSVIWLENAWHVDTCDIWRWQIALIWPDVNYPRQSQRSTGDWENLSNAFHNLTVGRHWWPNLKIAHLSFHSNGWFATFARSDADSDALCRIRCMHIRQVAHFKSHGLSRLAFFLHFQVPIKLFSFNHVVSILEYFSTNLQDWIWFCVKVVQLKEIPLLNFVSWVNLTCLHV